MTAGPEKVPIRRQFRITDVSFRCRILLQIQQIPAQAPDAIFVSIGCEPVSGP